MFLKMFGECEPHSQLYSVQSVLVSGCLLGAKFSAKALPSVKDYVVLYEITFENNVGNRKNFFLTKFFCHGISKY